MGESYLQRKVLDKMRRSRTQTSIVSSSLASLAGGAGLASASPAASSSSVSGGQLEATADTWRQSSSSVAMADQVTSESSAEATPSQAGSRLRNLKRASKAIVFFRRAASSVARAAGHSQSVAADQQQQQQQQPQADQQQTMNSGKLFMVPSTGALRMPIVCLIKSIEGELMRELFVHRYELGQFLMESLKVSLDLADGKYFGLRLAKHSQDQDDLENPWLDMNEPVWKQIKLDKGALASRKRIQKQQQQLVAASDGQPSSSAEPTDTRQRPGASRSIELYLRIKFYPPNVGRISDQFLRNYLWLQLRRDLRLGKLTSSQSNLAHLMACVLQFELADFRPELVELVPSLNILPNQDVIEGAAVHLWRTKLVGVVKHQVQMQFIRAAMILETYGFDYYPVRDHQRQRAYLLGFNYAGFKTIRNGRIVHHFAWHNLNKISYERRMIIFHVYPAQNSKRKQILGFKCLSNADCQHLYLRLLEQKYFFTVDLAYFDQSIRRPSCLHSSQSGDWSCSLDEQLAGRLPAGFSPTHSPPPLASEQPAMGRQPSGDSLAEQLSQHSNGTSAELQRRSACNHCDTPPSQCTLDCCRPAQAHRQHLWAGRLHWLADQTQWLLSLGAPSPERTEPGERQRTLVLPTLRFCAAVLAVNLLLRLADGISGSLVELLTMTRQPAPN